MEQGWPRQAEPGGQCAARQSLGTRSAWHGHLGHAGAGHRAHAGAMAHGLEARATSICLGAVRPCYAAAFAIEADLVAAVAVPVADDRLVARATQPLDAVARVDRAVAVR